MNVTDIIAFVEQTADLRGAANWDKSGVQYAAVRKNIGHLCVALDPSLKNIEEAATRGADMLLTHHPLRMKPYFLDAETPLMHALRSLVQNDMWLYAAHTSLDAATSGPVSWLAKELLLANGTVLEETARLTAAGSATDVDVRGFGYIGTMPEAVSFDAFCQKLAPLVPANYWRVCGNRPQTVERVAYCTGSGADLAEKAFSLGADVFITGDTKYHTALDSSGCIIDVGHFSLEEEMMRRFTRMLQEKFPLLTITFLPASDPLVLYVPTSHTA